LVKSLSYQVSKEKLETINTQLMSEAIDKFKQQAATITKKFDMNKYVIHQINVGSQDQNPPMHYAQVRMMAESAPANLQPNSSTIQVIINGSIQLSK